MLDPDRPSDDPSRHGGANDGSDLPPPPPVDDVPTADRDRDELRDGMDTRGDTRGDVVDSGARTVRDDGPDRDLDGRDDVADREVEIERTRSFSLGQLVSFVIGGLLLAMGIIALIRTGIDRPLDQPVEDILGWDHTPLLGLFEVGAGALLVLFALRPGGRWFIGLIGLALVAAGVLIASENDWTVDNLRAEQGYGWLVALAGAIAALAALITPRRRQRFTGVVVDER